MNPLTTLRKLLAGVAPNETATVVSIGSSISVSTKNGVRSVSSAIPVSVGDCVLVVNGTIQGKVAQQDDLPHYYL